MKTMNRRLWGYFGLIDNEYFPPTDPVGCVRSGDDRKRRHLFHHPRLLPGVRRRGRLQLGAVVECQRADRITEG